MSASAEQKRGCGYRAIGGLYLVSDPGFQLQCDGLPLKLEPCQCCGFEPAFSRNLQRINAKYIAHIRAPHQSYDCSCWKDCPICYPMEKGSYGLMFVGKQSYTPSSFIKEAVAQGVSKRIPEIPSWLELGKTWVFLAHNQTPNVSLAELQKNGLQMKEPECMKAIFYGFKPQRIEMPMWKGDLLDADIQKLEEKGITPVLLDKSPETLKRHKAAQNLAKHLLKYLGGA